MDNAVCVMCNRGVHYEAGRIACDGCDLPTDCCLCPMTAPRPRPPAPGKPLRPQPSAPAPEAGTTG